jgi:UPF0755 protein
MKQIRAVLDVFGRTILFVAAAGAMLLVCGGVTVYLLNNGSLGGARQPASSGSRAAAPQATPVPPQGPKDILVGLYLQLRQGEINRAAGTSDTAVTFAIDQGETAASVATHLREAGLVTDPDLFALYMRHNHLDSSLEAGNYVLRPNMTMPEVAQSLQHSKVDEVVITIPEGWRAEQIAEVLAANGLVQAQPFIDYVKQGVSNPGLATRFAFLQERPPGASTTVEGFLFPDTYRIPAKSDIKTIVDIMLSNFGRRFGADLQQAAKEQGKTAFEVVNLAAIVEREAIAPGERPIIASVYQNRLNQGKALEASPTVQYALGFQPAAKQWWKTPLSLDELSSVNSEYNTYLHTGLPPGPICDPGLSSLDAAVHPAKTDYLFFYSKWDGTHAFAATWEEHLKNQALYSGQQ